MIVRIQKTADFIPEWNGNQNDANPIKVTYRFPSTEERDRWIKWSNPVLESTQAGQSLSKIERIIDRKGMFLGLVTGIANLVSDDGSGKEKAILTAREVLDCSGLNDLYDEIVAHLIATTQQIDLKN